MSPLYKISLLFPTLAVVLANAAFWAGGRVAAWQWWLALGLAIVVAAWRERPASAAKGVVGYLAFMGGAWIYCGLFAPSGSGDEIACHFPAVRLLLAGWNPLHEASCESMASICGLPANSMTFMHILVQPKSATVLNALAHGFMREEFNLTQPAALLLFLPTVLQLLRSMSAFPGWARCAGVVFLVHVLPPNAFNPDVVAMLASVGLLLAFQRYLSGEGAEPLPLAVFSFWMLTAKPYSTLHCVIFWCVFLATVLLVRRWDGRIARAGLLAAALFVFAGFSPYGTSWRDHGHPLYPRYGGNAGLPVAHLTSDFITGRNADAAAMGRLGAFAHAYLSPSLVRGAYARMHARPDFHPSSWNWKQYPNDHKICDTPLPPARRRILLASLAVLLVFGGAAGRACALAMAAGLFAMPTEMQGYLRYVPWYMSAPLFAMLALAGRLSRDGATPPRAACLAILPPVLYLAFARPYSPQQQLFRFALNMSGRQVAETFLSTNHVATCHPRFHEAGRDITAGLPLLAKRQVDWLSDIDLAPLPADAYREGGGACPLLPGGMFHLPAGTDLQACSDVPAFDAESCSYGDKFRFMAHTYTSTFARLLIRRLSGQSH